MDDFEQYLEKSLDNLLLEFKPGMKVKGTVCGIDRKSVFIDINATSEGIINREEFVNKEGELTVKIGDAVEAFYIDQSDDGINLTVKMTGKHVFGHLEEAFHSGIPVEGKVQEERKGGYTVKIAGKDGFCPYSQMSLGGGSAEEFVGNTYLFSITELKRNNLLVSRRKILEKQRQELLEEMRENLSVGEILQGTVVNIKDFGVFVDLGGVQGFIPVSELSWSRLDKPGDIVKIGDSVSVSVIDLDWERNRITLSFRAVNSPWENVMMQFSPGTHCRGKVTRLENYGAFVEIAPGIEGLVHISKLGAGKRINHPREVVTVGEEIEVEVDSVDEERHRISLVRNMLDSMDAGDAELTESSDDSSNEERVFQEGEVVQGVVDSIKPYGVFVKLNARTSGLMHISEADVPDHSGNPFNALQKKYPLGTDLMVKIKEKKGEKLSLVAYEKVKKQAAEAKQKGNFKDNDGAGFGSLGNVFDGLEL